MSLASKNKKIIILGLITTALVLAAVSTTGCTTSTMTTSPSPSPTLQVNITRPYTTTPRSQIATPLALGQDVTLNATLQGTTHNIGQYYTARAGNKYVLVDVIVKNNRVNDMQIGNPGFFLLGVTDGHTYGYDLATFSYDINGLRYIVHSQPGDTVGGILVFQIPENAVPQKLIYADNNENRVVVNF